MFANGQPKVRNLTCITLSTACLSLGCLSNCLSSSPSNRVKPQNELIAAFSEENKGIIVLYFPKQASFRHFTAFSCYVRLFNVIEWHDTGTPDTSELWTLERDSDKVFQDTCSPDTAISFCNWFKTFSPCHLIITHQRGKTRASWI